MTQLPQSRRQCSRRCNACAVASVALLALTFVTAARAGDTNTAPTTPHKAATSRSHHYKVIVPESSRQRPGDVGRRAHTNYEILDTHIHVPPGAAQKNRGGETK